MDTKRLNEILEELIEVNELIDECSIYDRKLLYNLVKRKERLIMEKTDLLSNKNNND